MDLKLFGQEQIAQREADLRESQIELQNIQTRIARIQTELYHAHNFDPSEALEIYTQLIRENLDIQNGRFTDVGEFVRRLRNIADRLDSHQRAQPPEDPLTSIQREINLPPPIRLPKSWGDTFQEPDTGFPPAVPCVLASYTGVGKSRTAINIVRDQARHSKVLFLSLEMRPGQLWVNLMMQELHNQGEAVKSRREFINRIKRGDAQVLELIEPYRENLTVVDATGFTATDLVREYDGYCNHAGAEPGLVILDYAQIIEPEPQSVTRDRRLQILETLTILIKKIKRIRGCWINLSQTNRSAEIGGKGRAPDPSALQESSLFEQSAGFLMTLGLPKDADQITKGRLHDTREVEIKIAKQREGPRLIDRVSMDPVTGMIGEPTSLPLFQE